MLPENLLAFSERFDRVVRESISDEDKHPHQAIDAMLSLEEVYLPGEPRLKIPKFYRVLSEFEPFGPGNMKPVFWMQNVYSHQISVLKEAHLKLRVKQENTDLMLDAIGFGIGNKETIAAFGLPFSLACTFDVNVFRDVSTLQLMIKDIKPSDL